jgi:hypothetical protein
VALTDEQRAMLQLLLEGGQGYEDIGSLLGIAPDEVRSRARSALGEIGGADPDAQVGLSDYLLGQADPIGRADAIRHLQNDPEAHALAERLVQNLRLLAPRGHLPEIPELRGGRAAAPTPSPAPAPAATPAAPAPQPAAPAQRGPGIASRISGLFGRLGGLTGRRRTQFLAVLGVALALVVIVVVIASSGGGDGGSDCTPLDTSTPQQAGVPTTKLEASGAAADADCPPSGQITLGSVPQSQQTNAQTPTFAVQVNAVELQPPTNEEGYLLWLFKSDSQSVPLGPLSVDGNGNLTGTLPVPAQELLLFPAFQTLRLSKLSSTQAQQIQQSIQNQGKKPSLLIPYVGTTVLEGNVSDLGLTQLLQQAQAQAQAQPGAGAQAPQAGGKKG